MVKFSLCHSQSNLESRVHYMGYQCVVHFPTQLPNRESPCHRQTDPKSDSAVRLRWRRRSLSQSFGLLVSEFFWELLSIPISQILERIRKEHIEQTFSLESRLFSKLICSIRIRSRKWVNIKLSLQNKSNPYVPKQ